MKTILMAVLFVCSLSLSACGSGDKSDETDTSGNYLSGSCGSNVVSDYNHMVVNCTAVTMANCSECKSTAQSFLQKYPSINCRASKPSSRSVDNETEVVTSEKIQTLIGKMTEVGC